MMTDAQLAANILPHLKSPAFWESATGLLDIKLCPDSTPHTHYLIRIQYICLRLDSHGGVKPDSQNDLARVLPQLLSISAKEGVPFIDRKVFKLQDRLGGVRKVTGSTTPVLALRLPLPVPCDGAPWPANIDNKRENWGPNLLNVKTFLHHLISVWVDVAPGEHLSLQCLGIHAAPHEFMHSSECHLP